jgi:hypothetical protein
MVHNAPQRSLRVSSRRTIFKADIEHQHDK